ncbi:MBL fold metallo-hydrolase [Alkalilimnicola sp. S0819]|uniref:MBL fold metallo-hydrolase n=1 Tax=Alkalilimnicola sp. S0819 TaxID=2613922 RepID=UPI0012621D66|nr:MBL fold metallo-hydrolase [Alkalilimnicola sp. S0819]KAB7623337.1 MBL fold metallo-hydrolase [Alkalilimnicola sp. S0819]MPQ16876.1 MBL fold metallo-hydrolase [Alkalilimnicola sp. S0819]
MNERNAGAALAPLSLGAAQLRQLVDIPCERFGLHDIFPDAAPEDLAAVARRIGERHVDLEQGALCLSFYSTVARIAGKTVVIDTCCGNDKERPARPGWHRRQGDYLEQLAAQGVRPEDVDLVMCTHLHADHVGWNTRLENGRWVPTFPNARYVFAKREYDYWLDEHRAAGPEGNILYGSFRDSVLPVIDSGQAELVADGHSPLAGVHLEIAPGHTPGAALIHLESEGARAVVCGDLLHHPLQLLRPEVSTRFCVDPEGARRTRQRVLAELAGTETWVVPGHFLPPSIGRIERDGDAYAFLAAQ